MDKLIPKLKEKSFLPSEIVFANDMPDTESNGIADISIYFIKSGNVEIICKNIKKPRTIPVLKVLQSPAIIGIRGFSSGLFH